ncbi:MAG: hypothetical protein HY236_04225, partial [Acidobacteria bacterium]|nr:hypothetical protein [Acidobacteriota bacterium]
MRKLRLALLMVAVAEVALPQVNRAPLPPPYQSRSVNNGPRVISRPAGAALHLPPGFAVELYAEGFEVPRFMLLGPGQELLVADSASPGAVNVMTGKDRRKLVDGLDRPYGMAFWKDYLYIAETTALKRYHYDPKGMRIIGKGEEIVPMHSFGDGHWTRTVLFDREGKKMYLTVGSESNVSPGEDPRRAAI